MPQVVEQMHCELESQAGFLTDHTIRTIYFGGGTPSLLAPQEIDRLIEHSRAIFDCSAVEEITVEVNPDDVTDSYVAALAATSVNRISIGIQSFDDDCLRFMGRRHSAQQAVEAVERLQRAGFDNISVDIIFGVEGFGGKSLELSLQRATELGVQHISAYHLTIEPATRFGRLLDKGQLHQVSEECSEAEFALVHQVLTTAGFEHYEVSNFAQQGYRSRHNSSYWTGEEYLGIGPGAHSYGGGVRRWCEQSVEQYADNIEYQSETLTVTDALNEYVMVGLRRAEGINIATIAERWGEVEAARIATMAQRFVDAGWVVVEDGRLKILPEHFLTSDAVIGELFC